MAGDLRRRPRRQRSWRRNGGWLVLAMGSLALVVGLRTASESGLLLRSLAGDEERGGAPATTRHATAEKEAATPAASASTTTMNEPAIAGTAAPATATNQDEDNKDNMDTGPTGQQAALAGMGFNASLRGHAIRDPTPSQQRNPYFRTRDMPERTPKFLRYLSNGGWSNQEMCLQSAYYLARATGRILVLPPILPHKLGNDYIPFVNDLVERETKLESGRTLDELFLEQLPAEWYIPMERVVDVPYVLPNVTTMDYKVFAEGHWDGEDTDRDQEWIVDNEHTHRNTILLHDGEPGIHGTEAGIHEPTQTMRYYRDVARLEEEHPQRLWTFLDAFFSGFEMRQSLTRLEYHYAMHPFRFSLPIRRAARMIHESWGNLPYAAVHVRGGDSAFATPDIIARSIAQAMGPLPDKMAEWAQALPEADRPNEVGLFVATDITPDRGLRRDLSEFPAFLAALEAVRTRMGEGFGISVRVLRSDSFAVSSPAFFEELRAQVGYPLQFLDQQVLGCANIAVSGVPVSTFSGLAGNIAISEDAC